MCNARWCHQITTSRSLPRGLLVFHRLWEKSTKICAIFSLDWSLIFHFLADNCHHTSLGLFVPSSTSSIWHNSLHIQPTPLATLRLVSANSTNKSIFLDLELHTHFNIPKIHSLSHYKSSITLFGTTDNYNTENLEWLHSEIMKKAYIASNHKDKLPQMTTWLSHHEKVLVHTVFLKWQQCICATPRPVLVPLGPLQAQVQYPKMTHHPL